MNQRFWSNTLIRLAALFGAIGAGLGAHMAGAGSYALKPIHAHILVAGWLTVFAWGIFYRVVEVRAPKLAITMQLPASSVPLVLRSACGWSF